MLIFNAERVWEGSRASDTQQEKGQVMIAKISQYRQVSKRFISKTIISLVCLCLCASQAIAAENPQTVVKNFTDEVFQILRQNPENTLARRLQIEAVVDKYFDMEAIARLAIGPQWRSLSPDERQQFTQEFSKLLYYKYIGDIEKYARQKISYNNRTIYQDYVVVEARVGGQGGQSIDYYLHLRDGNWRVYDVGVQGISLVTNYRNQFDTILANSSFENLSTMLRQQIADLCRSNQC